MGKKILIIDDDPDDIFLLRKRIYDELIQADLDFVEATNGTEGVKLAESEKPSLAFVDKNLPDIDGFEVAEKIKALPNGGDISVLIYTGLIDDKDFERAMQAGADEIFLKNHLSPAFISVIRMLLD